MMDRTTITTYAASGTGVLATLTTNDLVAAVSVGVALATFILNWVYKQKHYRLAQKTNSFKPQGES